MNWRHIKDIFLIVAAFFALIPLILVIAIILLIAEAVDHHGDKA